MKILYTTLLILTVASCSPKVKFLVVEPVGDPEKGKQMYHLVELDGYRIETMSLDTTYVTGDVVKIKVKEQ